MSNFSGDSQAAEGWLETRSAECLSALKVGRLDVAKTQAEVLVRIAPEHPQGHFFCGCVCLASGNFQQAIDAYMRTTQLCPAHQEAWNNLGNAYYGMGRIQEAIDAYRTSIGLNPLQASYYFNLAGALRRAKDFQQARVQLEVALRLDPNYASAYRRLGDVAMDQMDAPVALVAYLKADALRPKQASTLIAIGNALKALNRRDEAIGAYRRVIQIDASSVDAWNNLGNTYSDLGRYEEAMICLEKSLSLKPNRVITITNIGHVHQNAGRWNLAMEWYDRALSIDPQYAKARFHRSIILLMQGDFERGFADYEARWQEALSKRTFDQPEWTGESLPGRTLLLHAEQGLGDTLQFVRYAPLVRRRSQADQLWLECQKPLVGLLSRSGLFDQVHENLRGPTGFESQVPLLSLPRILGTRLESVPATIPYLQGDGLLREHWARKLDKLDGLRVGIVWQGSTSHPKDRWRSFPLKELRQLSEIPRVHLISLQKGNGSEQIASAGFPVIDWTREMDENHGPFLDTAALLSNLDLVVACDTSIIHLAGALGTTAWLALHAGSEWRWLLDRDDSPWYPNLRIFRQVRMGDWSCVFANMAEVLRKWPVVTRPSVDS
jgi:tetratricopeptide (TPR) repeat protein